MRIATAHLNLGATLASVANYDEALVAFGEALRIREERLGPGHAQVASTLRQIAITHRAAGHSRAALEPAQRGYAINRANLGDDHLTVVADRVLLAKLAVDRGDAAGAVRRALEVLATPHGDSPMWRRERALAYSALGEAWKDLGRREEARAALVAGLELRKDAPPDDLVVMGISPHLAVLEAELGNIARAREIAAAAYAARTVGVDDDTHVADGLEILAAVEGEAGAWSAARAYRERALALRLRRPDAGDLFSSRVRFARMELRADAPEAALDLVTQALAGIDDDPDPRELARAYTVMAAAIARLCRRVP